MDKKVTENTRVADIVTAHPQVRQLFEALSIDYCCGGKQPLKAACQQAGLSTQDVIAQIEKTLAAALSADDAGRDWTRATLDDLTDHIVTAHHAYLREQFPRIERLLEKVFNAHKARHGDMLQQLKDVVETLRLDIEMHLDKEEQILFPLIKGMTAFSAGEGPKPTVHCGTVENPIRQMESEHDTAGDLLGRIHAITADFTLPDDACESFKALYERLRELESDLHEHIHLENNILFPRSTELERKLEL